MRPECERPLRLDEMVDYWFEEGPEWEAEPVEEHLMECEACSERLGALVQLGEGVRRVAREGGVQVVVTPSFLDTAERGGLRVRQYRVSPGERVACTVAPGDDLVVSRLQADLSGVARLDVVSDWEGRELRIEDVPVDPTAAELILAQAMPALRALGPSVTRIRLLAQDPTGERLLGQYTFAHTPTRG